MVMATCRECGGGVSSEAPACPHCGVPSPAGKPAPPSIYGVTAKRRRQLLDEAIRHQTRKGWGVDSVSAFSAYMSSTRGPNHILHFILTLVTFGAWLLVWLLVVLLSKKEALTINVDERGLVALRRSSRLSPERDSAPPR